MVKGAEAEIAVLLDLRKGDLFLVKPFDQGVDRGTEVDAVLRWPGPYGLLLEVTEACRVALGWI